MHQPKYDIGQKCYVIHSNQIRQAKVTIIKIDKDRVYYDILIPIVEMNRMAERQIRENELYPTKEEFIENLWNIHTELMKKQENAL